VWLVNDSREGFLDKVLSFFIHVLLGSNQLSDKIDAISLQVRHKGRVEETHVHEFEVEWLLLDREGELLEVVHQMSYHFQGWALYVVGL
jgi:hypothetical protein